MSLNNLHVINSIKICNQLTAQVLNHSVIYGQYVDVFQDAAFYLFFYVIK